MAAADTVCDRAGLAPEEGFALDLGPVACVLIDESRSLDLETVLSDAQSARFEPVPSGLVDFGFGSARYWVRAKLANTGDIRATWWITHDIPIADVRVRLVRGDGSVRNLLDLSSDARFDDRVIPHRHLVSTVTLDPGEEVELVIDYVTGLGTQMPLFAQSVARLVERTQTEMATHLLIIAIMLGMGAISTVYFYSLEGPPGLIYGAYVLAAVGFLANAEAYGFQFVYPGAVAFNQNAYPLLGLCMLAFGTWFISRLTRTKSSSRLLYGLVVTSVALLLLLVALSPVFLDKAWYKIGALLASVLASLVQVAVIASSLRQRQSGAWLLLAAFVVTGIGIGITVTGYLTRGLFPQEFAGSAMRLALFLEGVAYSGAIALRIREARRARDRSLRDQLRLTQESLRLAEAVQRAEADRQDAEREADRSRAALSSVAHDLRQPLTSIQMVLENEEAGRPDIAGSLGYIDDILRKGLETSPKPLGAGDADPVEQGARERFPLSLVLNNVAAMFEADARQRGVDLRVLPCSLEVVTDPLSLMRATSNLVSNALKHAGARRILVGCRRHPHSVRLEVHDDGKGMSEAELSRVFERGNKGEASDGDGLGLAIIRELTDQQDMAFDLASTPHRGTVGRIAVPRLPTTPHSHSEAQAQ